MSATVPEPRAGGKSLPYSGESYTTPEGDVYRLGYRLRIAGPLETVFHYVGGGTTYPEWWPVFLKAESDHKEMEVGARVRYHVKSVLPYHLHWDVTLVELDRPRLVVGHSVVRLGDWLELDGPIVFRFREYGPWVEVLLEQEMRTRRRLPGPLRALAGRVFAYNHDRAMRQGGRGLQRIVRAAVAEQAAAGPAAS